MRAGYFKVLTLLVSFFILVFTGAFAFNRQFPQLVITGEASVGTWMSGALLIMSATLCLILVMRAKAFPWLLLATFFFILALDERFMFHEQLKTQLIFSYGLGSRWMYELPVILGAIVGIFAAGLLWLQLDGTGRALLASAVVLGSISVLLDILASGVLWEECCKLIAELLVTCALLRKAGT